jgi:CP family cyanate transporter-like MFS transporter
LARIDLRSRVGWYLAIVFWLTALPFYGLMSWLAAAYIERGWNEVAAGTLVGLVGLAGLPATMIVAWMADRVGSRRQYLIGSTVVFLVAGVGLVLVPDLAWIWAILAGGSLGAQFTLAMTLPLDVSHDPTRASSIVGTMMFFGYLLTAMTPIFLGALRDLTGSFTASLWSMVIAGVVLLFLCIPLSPARLLAERQRGAHAAGQPIA